MNPSPAVDPVTINIVRHKLWSVLEEMGTTIKRTSISPIIWDANDFQTSLEFPDGSLACAGAYGATHCVCHYHVIKNVLASYGPENINPDDQFIMNDPYLGAAPHQADVSIVAPFFYNDKMAFWVSSSAHLLDIGAATSRTPREVYEEGWRLKPLKIVEGGKIYRQLLDALINMTRFPDVELDLQAMMAANNVAKARLGELFGRYGAEEIAAVGRELIRSSAEEFRARVSLLPDATLRHVDYIDHDGYDNLIFEIRLTLTKKDDHLCFDYTGSSPQARGIPNTCMGGATGGVLAAVGQHLGHGISLNQGMLDSFEVILPEASVCNARPPAPTSGGSTEASWAVRVSAETCLSKLMSMSEELAIEAMGAWMGGTAPLGIGGVNQHGRRFFYPMMDHLAGGCGARSYADGLNVSGTPSATMTFPNAETHEEFAPMLILFRRESPNTGGAGRYRGGLSLEEAFILHGAEEVMMQLKGHGMIVPNTPGIFGSCPGSNNDYVVIRDCDVRRQLAEGKIPIHLEEIGGKREFLPPKGYGLILKNTECIFGYYQGGAGYGDPLERSPEEVLRDVILFQITPEIAEQVYGVRLTSDHRSVDHEATAALRQQVRKARLK